MKDAELYALFRWMMDEFGSSHLQEYAGQLKNVVHAIVSRVGANRWANAISCSSWMQHRDTSCDYVIVPASSKTVEKDLVVLVNHRPEPIFPLYMASARRAVRFVHGVVALVTANAYISTLGGGHFLCKHLTQAKLMARLQIAVSMGLQDPILESKCRINLAYNAMQAGRFRRAQRIIRNETQVAARLKNDELAKVCHAAQTYLVKTYRVHRDLLSRPSDRLVDDFYRQRIVRSAT